MILKSDDFSRYLNNRSIIEGFDKLRKPLKPEKLRKFVKSYIEIFGFYDFNRFLRDFAKTVIVDYLHEYTSMEMAYYLYNIDWGMSDDYILFCNVYNKLMHRRHRNRFRSYLKHLGVKSVYIYQFNNEQGIQFYIDVFESKFLSNYILRFIEAPSKVYKELIKENSFEYSRLEIHRYLNRIYNYTKKM